MTEDNIIHNSPLNLQENLAQPLLPRLASPHILEAGVESVVGLDQLLDIPNQLIVLRFTHTKNILNETHSRKYLCPSLRGFSYVM